MSEMEWREYSDAVDKVCIECLYETGKECESCMVRKTMDRLAEERK